MESVKEEQIEKLLEDIASIQAVIKNNRSILRQIFLTSPFRLFFLILGLTVILYSALFYFFVLYFGDFDAIPGFYKSLYYGLLFVTWLAFVLMKYITWLRTLRKIDSKYTLKRALKEVLTPKSIHILLPVTFVMIFLIIYLIFNEAYRFIVPAISIAIGLSYNFFGSITDIKPYLVVGYWLLITGTLIIAIGTIPIPIALAASIGCGHVLFAAISHKED
jgi:hypothetical protein